MAHSCCSNDSDNDKKNSPWPHVLLQKENAEATIYIRGATLSSFTVSGIEWLGTRGDATFDGSKKNVSGGIPICFPQFGHGDIVGRDIPNPENPYDIPVHGLVRNMDWTLLDEDDHDDDDGSSSNSISSSQSCKSACLLEVHDTEESRKVWPHKFSCRCHVRIEEDQLCWSFLVTNTSVSSPFDFTCGVHSYFHTSDVDQARIEGPFKECTKLNRKVDPPEQETYQEHDVRITAFTDDIYREVLPGTVTLHDGIKSPLHIVSAGGWQDIVVWNPYENSALGYQSFVCIESVASRAITLQPAETWSASVTLIPAI